MNLWVKRTGQLLVAVLFLVSCEDDSYLLGFQNKNKKFNVKYQELSIKSSSMLVDSVITDNLQNPARFLVGRYFDNALGEVRSESYSEFYPYILDSTNTFKDPGSAVFDSMTVQLRFDTYIYGSAGETNETLSLHALQEKLSSDLLVDSLNFHYYYNSTIAYDPTPITTASQNVHYDSLIKPGASSDTLLFKFTMDNMNSFGNDVFNFIKNNTITDDSTFFNNFREAFKGLAIVPSSTNNKILGYSTSNLSGATIYYHNDTEDSLYVNFIFGILGFSKISTDRSTSELAGLSSYQEQTFDVMGTGYVQAGSPVITELDLSDFYSFADTIPNLVINSAELLLTPELISNGLEAPSSIILRLQHENNQFLNYYKQEDRDRLLGYQHLALNGRYFAAGSDINELARFEYRKGDNKYSTFITLFVQDLFDNKAKSDRIQHISITAVDAKTVNRLIFNKNSVKLKIHYTTPISSNL